MGDQLLNEVRVEVGAKVEAKGGEWDEDDWTPFVQEAVRWLHDEKNKKKKHVVAAAAGLILYGVTNEEELHNVADNKKEFAERLAAERYNVPAALCDLLFDKYVAGNNSAGRGGEKKSVEDVMNDVLGDTKCREVVELPVFEGYASTFPRIEATNARLGRGGRAAPDVPGVQSRKGVLPNMLFLGVQDKAHKDKAVYKWILDTSTAGPSSMYGTSGCGKTRSIMEFLAVNYGFYFSATGAGNGAGNVVASTGSDDMSTMLKAAAKECKGVEHGERYDVVEDHLRVLVLARLAVFEHVEKIMGRVPTPYEWLLVQLYPTYFFEDDVFADLSTEVLYSCTTTDVLREVDHKLVNAAHLFRSFVDESQHLFELCPKTFPSMAGETKGQLNRAMYSAVTKGFMGIGRKNDIKVGLTYPVMTGTGVSYEHMKHAVESAMAKETLVHYQKEFTAFPTQSREQVQAYMQTVADLANMGDTFVKHTARWLEGRPRWAATFLSLWMRGALAPAAGPGRQGEPGARLSQSRSSRTPLLSALDAYLDLMTTEQAVEDKRKSNPLVAGTPFDYVGKVEAMWAGEDQASFKRVEVLSAILKFAVTGEGQLIREDCHELIRNGLCAYDAEGLNVMLTEPLIVEAALNRLDLDTYLATRLLDTAVNASTSGFKFEDYSILPIRNKFLPALSMGELGIESASIGADWKKLTKIGPSSYGVLAERCTTAAKVLNWLRRSMDSTLDGEVAPFCFPDEKMGPDLLFFVRDPDDWDSWRLSMWQHKFKTTTNQAAAMRTVDPALLHCMNRDTASPRPALTGKDAKQWDALRAELFGEKRGASRKRPPMSVLLEYPAKVTKLSASTQEKDGHLRLGIDVDNGADKLFVANGLRYLDEVKAKHSNHSYV